MMGADLDTTTVPARWSSPRNPRWSSRSTIDCEVTIAGLGEVTYTASAEDSVDMSRDIHAALIAGIAGPITAWRPEPAPVPVTVTAFQARAALLSAGLLDEVEAAVTAADRSTQLAWEYALSFERGSPTIQALSTAIGLDDEALDDLFRAAAQITA